MTQKCSLLWGRQRQPAAEPRTGKERFRASRAGAGILRPNEDNIKQWNQTLRDGQLSQRIVLSHFCLPDAPFDSDSRNKRKTQYSCLVQSDWPTLDSHQSSLAGIVSPPHLILECYTGVFHLPQEGKEYQFNCFHQSVSGMLLFRHSKGHLLRYQDEILPLLRTPEREDLGHTTDISLPIRKQPSHYHT